MPIQATLSKPGASLPETRRGSRRIIQSSIRQTVSGLLGLAAVLVPAVSWAEPFRPSDTAEILETLPTPGNAAARELRAARRDLAADPENLMNAIALARRYIRLGRSEADPRYYGYAQAALGPWWNLAGPPVGILVLRAVIRQSQHQFDGALADLDRTLAINPAHAQAWLSRAFILQVQGRYDEALKSCGRLPSAVSALVQVTCAARIQSLSGQAPGAFERLSRVLDRSKDVPPPLRLWALTVLAEIAELSGQEALAARTYREALSLGLRDAYLLGVYADFLLDRGRHEDVRELLAGENRTDALLLRLALAERQLGDPEAANHIAVLEARFEASRRRGDTRHRRAEARFALHVKNEPERALRLALDNWRSQKEPGDARLVLETVLASGATEEARAVLAWLAKSGLKDARLEPLAQRLKEGQG